MNVPMVISWDLLTGLISFVLTLMVLSYLIGDNPVFRVAIYIFVGVSAGYAAAIAWNQVLFPRLVRPLVNGGWTSFVLLVPLFLGLMMFLKLSPRTARLGNPSLALIVGVGAAVAVGGAVLGTLFPQTQAVVATFELPAISQGLPKWLGILSEAVIMFIGTVTTLIYFHFGAKPTLTGPERHIAVKILGMIGQVFVAITFGVIFAGVFAAAMTALISRLDFLVKFVSQIF